MQSFTTYVLIEHFESRKSISSSIFFPKRNAKVCLIKINNWIS